MRHKLALLICLIFFASFPLVVFALSSEEDYLSNHTYNQSYPTVRAIGNNLCDSDYSQIGESNYCEKIYTNMHVIDCSNFLHLLGGKCKNVCEDSATHDGEVCEIPDGVEISEWANSYGTCYCRYKMPGTADSDYEKLHESDSMLNGGNLSPDIEIPTFSNCKSLLGNPSTEGTPAFYVYVAFNVTRYVAIILLIVLSVMDMVGAVASSDSEIINKTVGKIAKRFLFCVLIFMLPYLIKFILSFLDNASTDMCGIGE